jgi:hypothetical protein
VTDKGTRTPNSSCFEEQTPCQSLRVFLRDLDFHQSVVAEKLEKQKKKTKKKKINIL